MLSRAPFRRECRRPDVTKRFPIRGFGKSNRGCGREKPIRTGRCTYIIRCYVSRCVWTKTGNVVAATTTYSGAGCLMGDGVDERTMTLETVGDEHACCYYSARTTVAGSPRVLLFYRVDFNAAVTGVRGCGKTYGTGQV